MIDKYFPKVVSFMR